MTTQLVVYLDIDGVLNTADFHQRLCESLEKQCPITAAREKLFSKITQLEKQDILRVRSIAPTLDYVEVEKLERLKAFIERHSAKVIIISSWARSKEDAYEISSCFDMPQIEWDTDYYTIGGKNRGERVYNHMKRHGIRFAMVLDDLWKTLHEGYWHRCIKGFETGEGLTNRELEMMEQHLVTLSK